MPATRSGRGFRESSAKCVELDMMLERRIKQERDDCPAEMRVEMCGPLASRCDHEVPRRGSRAQFLDQKTADNMIWINCCPPPPSHGRASWRRGARSCKLCAWCVPQDPSRSAISCRNCRRKPRGASAAGGKRVSPFAVNYSGCQVAVRSDGFL